MSISPVEIGWLSILGLSIYLIMNITSWFKKKPSLESFDQTITRERLIQSGRIIVVDDETPLLIGELKDEGFAVDHDLEGKDLHNIESQIYDLAILDYHGVGQRLGNSQGLDLLKHIRRVSPRTRLIAYTSRSLNAAESEFFRLSHAVLPKDLGLGDSLALIEGELRKAFSKEYLFEALILKLQISSPIEKQRIQDALIKALSKGDAAGFREKITKIVGSIAEKAVEIIISKLFLAKP
jgi:CheY-like chemotaxis protein